MGRSYRPILRSAETCHGLGAARGLAYIAHVVDMKVDEFAESFLALYGNSPAFHRDRPDARFRSLSSSDL